jgi:hypothetical protein
MFVAQFVLDMFPDCISQFGLIGCGLSVAIAADAIAVVYLIGRRAGMLATRRMLARA